MNSFYKHYKPEPKQTYKFTFFGSVLNSVASIFLDIGHSLSKTARNSHMTAE